LGRRNGLAGAGIGAGIGALGGAGKYLWDKYKQGRQNNPETAKQQALDALKRLNQIPEFAGQLDKLINDLSDLQPQQLQAKPTATPQQPQPQQPQQPQQTNAEKWRQAGHNIGNHYVGKYGEEVNP